MSLPGVAELLRPTAPAPEAEPQRPASGRECHSHKITVYLSAAELWELERARLALRGYGIEVDRGRIVREALAVLLADLDAEGERSLVARRLEAQRLDDQRIGAQGIGAQGIGAQPLDGRSLADGHRGS